MSLVTQEYGAQTRDQDAQPIGSPEAFFGNKRDIIAIQCINNVDFQLRWSPDRNVLSVVALPQSYESRWFFVTKNWDDTDYAIMTNQTAQDIIKVAQEKGLLSSRSIMVNAAIQRFEQSIATQDGFVPPPP